MKTHIAIILVATLIFKIIFHGNFLYLLIGVSFAYITGMLPWVAWNYTTKKLTRNHSAADHVPESGNSRTRHPAGTLQSDPAAAALMAAIKEKRKSDPLVGAKLGSKEVSQRLIDAMKNERGVHVESLLCALGALAGYSCQANLRAQALLKGLSETTAFTVVDAADGRKYFFGDPLNQALAESQYSVWSLAAASAQHNGCSSLPDIAEIFGHVSKTVGSAEFGIPRIPDGHQPGDSPINYVRNLWPNLLPTLKQFCQKPSEWPILFGLAVQEVMNMSKGVIAPDLALKIVMESAIPMSKVDLASA